MSFTKSTALLGALSLLSKVSAHGTVRGIVAGGEFYQGYNPSFQFSNPPPEVAGWTADNLDNGFVNDYQNPDIICHKSATPGKAYVTVAAGGTVELQWTDWPESHRGPMIDYLASCGDDCTTVDKTSLLWNKIDEAGLNDGSSPPGDWASDDMIANNNSWVVTIPSFIAPGKYVLRHETIALHSAGNVGAGGAQAYPQCINLEVTGSGSNALTGGTLGTELYTETDPGIHINIYQVLTEYIIPGPAVIDGAGSGAGNGGNDTPVPFPNSTTTSRGPVRPTSTSAGSVAITATPTTGNAVVSPKPTGGAPTTTSASTVDAVPTPPAEDDEEEVKPTTRPSVPVSPGTGSGPGPIQEDPVSPLPSSTSPVSFTSTVTGRIGKPTKFTCYIEE